MSKGKNQHVTPHPNGGWQVKGEGNSRATARTKKLEQSINEQQAILERDAEHLDQLSNIINEAYSIVEESVRRFESAGHEIRDARELLRRCIETQSIIIEQFERIEDYNRAIKGEQ